MAGVVLALALVAAPAQGVWYEPPPEIAEALDTAAGRYGIRSQFLRCVAWHESRYDPNAVSPAGYRGLLQFDRQTWSYGAGLAGLSTSSPLSPWAASEVTALLLWRGEQWRWGPARWCGSIWA